MDKERIIVSVTGCGLGDFLYKNVNFLSPAFHKYKSLETGDGGLTPGKLVFTEELEKFSKKSFRKILDEITGSKQYDTFNIGGPALVSFIAASQLLYNHKVEMQYYGVLGNDEKGSAMMKLLNQLSLNMEHYEVFEGDTPYTDVLSDPNFNNGRGERTFINNIGCAAQFSSDCLDGNFWKADMIVFGGTALVPHIHAELTNLLVKAKTLGAMTVVNTVYDFPNEKRNPDKPWPLGDTMQSLPLIDLLIMDYEESKHISGSLNLPQVIDFFKVNGSNAFIITRGSEPSYIFSSGFVFASVDTQLEICSWIADDFIQNPHLKGDTTGCGDNFAGGVIASIITQIIDNNQPLSLLTAAQWGTVSGGLACYHVGGTYFEEYPGQKQELTAKMMQKYLS